MYSQRNPKAQIGCLVALVVVILLTSYLATASLNPVVAYTSGNLVAKIIVIVLSVLLVISLLQMLYVYILIRFIGRAAGVRSGEDVICPGCGLPLVQYIGSHGAPILCPKCKKPWHNGPACYNKGMPHPGKVAAFPLHLCPNCRSTASDNRDLFDDKDFTSF